jgi:hypothetical protein
MNLTEWLAGRNGDKKLTVPFEIAGGLRATWAQVALFSLESMKRLLRQSPG